MVYHPSSLDATFFALADPTRRDILARLAEGDRTISELASRFDMSLPAVSKHVRMLQRVGLARVERQGRVRRASLRSAPLRDAVEWIDSYRRFWESELDLLAAYLEVPQSPEPECPNKPPPSPLSKSAGSSARRGSASSTRGPRRKS
ncbi:MAG: metalloregulator ArsR/SmtB family transcription factor [Gemmatimonadaceae bacterium]